ncbi:MAG: 3-phosphoshikimate 1-carboxyvinyltransferase [Synergistaceae bacterium]|jgi:3-phosphoshikimate 1-carboxyvinyltransferase|nr:3-phosphoshikimate 1-carboxyvinyltransferase [Synergistaceae bacterium]
MEDIKIISRFPKGVITPPPSKSLTHRAVICASLAQGESVIENFSRSLDTEATIRGVEALRGVDTDICGDTLRVARSAGEPDASRDSVRTVDCGESGSTLRFLLPIAALDERQTIFTGHGRLLDRPLGAYAQIFPEMGALLIRAPERIVARGRLKSGVYNLPGDVSSQFVSGLLFALPLLEGDSEIRLTTQLESAQYVDLTIDIMRRFGVEVGRSAAGYMVKGGANYRPTACRIETDYSQAAFFLASAALGCDVRVAGLNPDSLQGDMAILRVLRDMGAEVLWSEDGEGRKIVSIDADLLSPITVDAREIPDLVPPIATLCCFCDGVSRIVNAGRLRLKESDRLSALRTELSALGANIEESGDSLVITGVSGLKGGHADSWGDHRIAMSMALAAIRCDEPVLLSGWQSVNKSYPGFWRDFEGDRS